MKLKGEAKRAFLAKMAAGRARRRRVVRTPDGLLRDKRTGRVLVTQGPRVLPRRRRKNPDLVTILNPGSAEMARARAAYRRFHGVDPKTARRGRGKGILIALGELREVVYQPRRGHRRGPAFFHRFGRGAVLAADPTGRRVFIVPAKGKPFRVDWSRGIIG